jgi:TDG/mug DNA glycosylase family protein
VALDATLSMLDLVPRHAPEAPRVQADLARLPFAGGSLATVLAAKAYVHLDARRVPRALADLHRALAPDGQVALSFFGSGPRASDPTVDTAPLADDRFAGRRYSRWHLGDLRAVVEGAGLETDGIGLTVGGGEVPHLWVEGRRRFTLPDTVGPGMRLLVCGLNPSPRAARAGIGFVTPGNRFWPAAQAAGLVSRDRDPWHALDQHGVGMTDLAKRATRRADEVAEEEYRRGLSRVERLVRWLSPDAVCFVGLAGYRAAVDRRASAGVQDLTLGDRPVYLMPSTSGLNAHSRLEDLTEHLHRAMALRA